MRYQIATLFFTIFFTGCSLNYLAPREYTLDPQASIKSSAVEGCKDTTLKMKKVFGSSDVMSERMSYALGSIEHYQYSKARWQEAPSELLTQRIIEALRQTEIFKEVIEPSSRAKGEWLLEVSVSEFIQKFDADAQNSKVDLKMHLSIVERKSDTVVASKTIALSLDAKSDDAYGGVKALNEALQRALYEQQSWLEGVCR